MAWLTAEGDGQNLVGNWPANIDDKYSSVFRCWTLRACRATTRISAVIENVGYLKLLKTLLALTVVKILWY